jgi:serine/threonine-protein kinase
MTSPVANALPRRLGPFWLLERIGQGGMAEVFRAVILEQDRRPRAVAIKVLWPHLSADPSHLAMLAEEAELLSRLRHPNVLRVHGLGRAEGQSYLVMELVRGVSLADLVEWCAARTLGFEPKVAAHLMAEVLDGLHAAHGLRDRAGRLVHLVHRDVSPGNVLVSTTGTAKICDFGIAKTVGTPTRTEMGTIRGKLQYMSPEQVSGLPLDRRSDVFSAGAVLYELVTSVRPFLGDSTPEILDAVTEARYAPPGALAPELPPTIDRAIQLALRRRRSARFQSAESFARALREATRGRPVEHWCHAIGRLVWRVLRDRRRADEAAASPEPHRSSAPAVPPEGDVTTRRWARGRPRAAPSGVEGEALRGTGLAVDG